MKRYNPREIEAKWQKNWLDNKSYEVDDNDPRPKYYHLIEFPYPSGAGLHVGHTRPYITFDIMSRWRRMKGENVLYPIGWDAFGLPAEQYALKTGVHPSITTKTNIDNFRQQARSLGVSFDWSREFATSDPNYYKWTQWIFLNLFKHGLAYQAESMVWWCEDLKSVLADEEVINGRSERGDFPCERRPLRQWMLAITKYADRLYDDLDDVDYIEPVKVQQRHWIGRSKGARIKFQVENHDDLIEVFTTRPDTLFGATYLVLAPEHPLVSNLTTDEQREEVNSYVAATAAKSDLNRQEQSKEKTGVFLGSYVINPVNEQKIPIWTADYVLGSYGTGAIMAVPGHDERDYEFALKFNLPIIEVVEPQFGEAKGDETHKQAIVAIVRNPKTNEILVLDWGPRRENWGGNLFIGGGIEEGEDPIETAKREIAEETGYTHVEHKDTSKIGVNNYFYSNVKNKNYHARFLPMLFELVDEERVEPKLDENEDQFSVRWVAEADIAETISDPAHLHSYNLLTSNLCYTGEGIMINSGAYDGTPSSEAREKITADLNASEKAYEVTTFKLRDWVFSRQRYWGEPFPIVWIRQDEANVASGEAVNWLPENPVTKQIDGETYVAMPICPQFLPVELPEIKDFQPKGLGQGPLAEAEGWHHVWYNTDTSETQSFSDAKPEGNWVEGKRETDTMPNWAGSSWYYLRYLDSNNQNELVGKEQEKAWMNVDWYNGGMEHTTLHLLYSRFWHKFLFDIGVVSTHEPYQKRTSHGLVLASDGRKMSKSWGNFVDPMEVVNDYGSDTLRLYIAFIGPFDQAVAWNINGVAGCRRFIERFWTLAQTYLETNPAKSESDQINNKDLNRVVNLLNKRITQDLPRLGFNTSVAALMEAVNSLYKIREISSYADNQSDWGNVFRQMIIMLAPFTPHLSEELWQQFGFEGTVLAADWKLWDESVLSMDSKSIAIQINGKLRGEVEVSVDAPEAEVIEKAKQVPKVAEYLNGKNIVREIYVADKLVNFVIS